MRDLQEMIIKGIRELVPCSQNMTKAFNIQREKDEGPMECFNRLKEQMRKYAGLDGGDSLGQGMLKLHFVTNSWPDITKKLQKIQNWKDHPIGELLREAQVVYVRRDEEKQKHKAKILLSLQQGTPQQAAQRNVAGKSFRYPTARPYNRGKGIKPGNKGIKRGIGQNKCFKCRKEGHFIRECPEWKKEKEITPFMIFEEEWGARGSTLFTLSPTKSP